MIPFNLHKITCHIQMSVPDPSLIYSTYIIFIIDQNTENKDIAKAVEYALREDIADTYWIVMVNDYDSTHDEMHFNFSLNGLWTETYFYSKNLARKSLMVTGLAGISAENQRCTNPIGKYKDTNKNVASDIEFGMQFID